ncbi:transcription termination factor Rho [Corynebacterium propinquum]|uniref:transcription termination factor Rho n=1 Tax=Corynebacterium propinquum TaxID=43769 RepID=UPI00266F2331|nr:transcription termination factor Rho [Corynebacterium propinquum]WKS32170.1 transcription termination factor Rho [Corynebacterium propinquum]WKS36492.1 transcription termination factor Rho [Corynebacterium propinquum]WKS38662.1 transcription termination factor Rho [Corynebacterium propinquum]WKS42934.1 transcription termination factor Rho [Corynebacterium propinquum]WKS47262.1 transcription termination factor Rho [Corynebacterium propinquum]
MSTTDNPDLYSMKLPELRELAIEKGLKSITALRKGELIMAIETGKVPRKSTEKPLPRMKKSEMLAQRAARLASGESDTNVRDLQDDAQQGVTESYTERSNESRPTAENLGDDAPSPAAARRARRARVKARANEEHQNNSGNGEVRNTHEQRSEQDAAADRTETGADDVQSLPESNDEQRQAGNTRRGRRGRRVRRLSDSKQHQHREQEQNFDNAGDQDASYDAADSAAHDEHAERSDRTDREQRNRGPRGGRDDRDNRDSRDNRDNRSPRDNRNNNDSRGGDNRGGGDNRNNNDGRNNGLQEVAGILEVVDGNTAFLRTTGYRPSSLDVFVNTNLVRRFHLRTGDYLTGKVKMTGGGQSHGKGRNRKKYNQMVFVETVNGLHPEEAKQRPQFSKLTPLYPNKRLRLETEPKILTTRVIDLIMPIGKGQRALIVSPPKAGKTTILQNIANAISTNNPECYLMVVLVDERPEEVTDMQRNVNGEVIASTFDRPPSEHTAVAELAIERAKRLVEQGQDVVVLLDSITRLGRAYNNSSPASGRILSGGVDSNALYPPKRFLGAARNIEDGGSLTIIATAMVETGSTGDTVIFEEFKGTGNAELKLDRGISERRVFPAVDVNPSGTRKDELLLVPEEARIMTKLRRILSALDSHQAIDLLIKQLRKTNSNGEFLMQVASSAPMAAALEEED